MLCRLEPEYKQKLEVQMPKLVASQAASFVVRLDKTFDHCFGLHMVVEQTAFDNIAEQMLKLEVPERC